jgi:hypothetical protein
MTASSGMTVRSTVNLPGLRAGDTATVNVRQRYVQDCLRAKLLVPVEEKEMESGLSRDAR